jgi:hypothetical protein
MKQLALSILIVAAGAGVLWAKGGPPINDVCPVDGKPARPIYRVFTNDGTVAFCCVDCTAAYQKNPGRYPVKKKD